VGYHKEFAADSLFVRNHVRSSRVAALPDDVQRRVVSVITLIRYFKWSLTLQERAAPYMKAKEAGEQLSDQDATRCVGLLSYWFASLYVVVEGWRDLELQDSEVEALLSDSAKLDLLRRFRNGVFHFQASYTDKRFSEFFGEGLAAVGWAQILNSAFFEFFRPHLDKPQTRLLEAWLRSGTAAP
jgi:hypothetical protein